MPTKKQRSPESLTGLKLGQGLKFGRVEPPRIKLPWATEALDAIRSVDLSERIIENMGELVARAFHLSVDRWTNQAPADLETEMSTARLEEDRRIRKSIQEGLNSTNARRRKAAETMRAQLAKLERTEAQRAVLELARIGHATASWLEYLADERLELVQPVARRFPLWPFNLAMSKVKQGGRRDILRAKLAKRYLEKLGLGLERYLPGEVSPLAVGKPLSPFRLAAEQVLEQLRAVRAHPHAYLPHCELPAAQAKGQPSRRIPIGPVSQWVTELFALEEPMTTANWAAWWRAARTFLVEQWEQNRDTFQPLIHASGHEEYLKPPRYKPSFIKTFIIDQRLRNEFKTLALPGGSPG